MTLPKSVRPTLSPPSIDRYPGAMAADTQHLSQATYDRLRAEHEDLTTRGRIDIARKIEVARELGDLSENGDYHAAKEEQGKMEGRIQHLARILENAEITEGAGNGVVAAGSVVTIRYDGDEGTERYLIGSIEERAGDLDVMSPGSALGAALMGRAAGGEVSYETPTGATLTVAVVDVGD